MPFVIPSHHQKALDLARKEIRKDNQRQNPTQKKIGRAERKEIALGKYLKRKNSKRFVNLVPSVIKRPMRATISENPGHKHLPKKTHLSNP